MATLSRDRSVLVLVDLQARMMPAIAGADAVVTNGRRLLDVAGHLKVPVVFTEQNPAGLGATVPELDPSPGSVVPKMSFDACRTRGFLEALPAGDLVVSGCEAHVCVLQTVLGLLDRGRAVYVVADAVGSRRPESKEAALRRAERHGAEIVTTEMVIFEWLETSDDPRFRTVLDLIR